jgi:hypothetical protein
VATRDFTDYWKLLSDDTYSGNVSGIHLGDSEYPGFSGRHNLNMWLNDTARYQIDSTMFPAVKVFNRVREDGIATLDTTTTEGWIKKTFPW